MTGSIRIVSKRNIYYTSIVLGAIYWSMIASPRYCAQASLVVEERQNIGVSAAVAGRERYILSKDGRALLGAWLKSEAPFRIIDARKPRQGLYNEASHFKRLLHIGSLRKSGDWSHWKIFQDDLKISEDAQFISLKFESFDAQASYSTLKEIISSAREYLIRHSEENDDLYRNREDFTRDYYENKIRKIELEPETKYRSIVLSELSELYRSRDKINNSILENNIEYTIKNNYYGNNSAALKGIATNVGMLRDHLSAIERDIGKAIKTLPSAELREVQLSTAVNAIAENISPDYSIGSDVSMPQYKISMISGPNQFGQEFGPQRMRSFLITLLLFSIFYWIVKD